VKVIDCDWKVNKGQERVVWNYTDKKYKKKKQQWIYFIVMDGKIVKIGGTADGIGGRFSSYSAGSDQNRERGTCSVTNYVVHRSIINMLKEGVKIEVYGYFIGEIKMIISDMFGEDGEVEAKVYHLFESRAIQKYIDLTGNVPHFSLNSDKGLHS